MTEDRSKYGVYVVIGFLVILLALILFQLNPYSKIQNELEELYHAAFEQAIIISVQEYPYEGGRGNYKKFKTSQHNNSFPVILERDFYKYKKYFVPSSVLNKTADSYIIQIIHEGKEYKVQIGDYKSEDNRLNILFIAIFGVVTLTLKYFLSSRKKWLTTNKTP